MGYNARNDEIRDNVTLMQRQWEAERGALATVRRSFAIMAALTAAGVLFANGALAQEQPLSFKEKLRRYGHHESKSRRPNELGIAIRYEIK